MLHLFTCHGRIMPCVVELLLSTCSTVYCRFVDWDVLYIAGFLTVMYCLLQVC